MAYNSLASRHDLADKHYPPARSIPNLSNNASVPMVPKSDSFHMGRSSSQPPETWCRENQTDEDGDDTAIEVISAATQTDTKVDILYIEQFILANPRIVLNLLGIDPPYVDIMPTILPMPQVHSLIPIPESCNSPDTVSPQREIVDDYGYEPNNVVWSPKNPYTNHHHHHHRGETCRSTDALLDDSSDEYFRSKENLSNLNETVNFSIIREGSLKLFRSHQDSGSGGGGGRSEKLSNHSSTENSPTSNAPLSPESEHLLNNSSTQIHRLSAHRRDSCGGQRKNSYHAVVEQPSSIANILVDIQSDFDESGGEKQALLSGCNSLSHRSSTTEIHKRSQLAPRQPVNYRFSAGDADKLEKGIRTHPSTRSLKES